MNGLRLHRVEHRSFIVKFGENFYCLRMIPRNDNSYVFLRSWLFTLNFCCLEIKTFLLTCFIEPIREKSCSLRLLLASSTAHIKQNIRIYSEKFVNDAKHSLHYLDIIRRCNMIMISEVKPISFDVKEIFVFKGNGISTSLISFKEKYISSIPNFIRGENIDKSYFKTIHCLSWLQIVNMLFFNFCLHAKLLFVHSHSLCFTSGYASLCTIEPCSDLFRSSLRKCRLLCFHNLRTFSISGCKFNNLF